MTTDIAATGFLVAAVIPIFVVIAGLGVVWMHGIRTQRLDRQIAELQERRAAEIATDRQKQHASEAELKAKADRAPRVVLRESVNVADLLRAVSTNDPAASNWAPWVAGAKRGHQHIVSGGLTQTADEIVESVRMAVSGYLLEPTEAWRVGFRSLRSGELEIVSRPFGGRTEHRPGEARPKKIRFEW